MTLRIAIPALSLLLPATVHGGERLVDTYLGQQDATIYGYDPLHQTGSEMVVGDFNDDGIGDLALAVVGHGPDGSRWAAGELHIFFGGPRLSGDRVLDTGRGDVLIYGDAPEELFGAILARADLNRDGIDDLLVGSPNGDGPGGTRTDAGEVSVFFGRATWPRTQDLAVTPPDLLVFGADAGDFLGGVAAADFSGDGIPDLAMSAWSGRGPSNSRVSCGEVHVLFGPLSGGEIDLASTSADATIFGARARDQLSLVASGASDLDHDGLQDLVLKAEKYDGLDGSRTDDGALYGLFSPLAAGVYDLATYVPGFRLLGTDPYGVTTSVALGDLDDDGWSDVAVGLDVPDRVYVLLGVEPFAGDVDLALRAPDLVIQGPWSSSFGRSLAFGDVTGDGHADLIVGGTTANRYDDPWVTRTGAAYVIAGGCALPSGIDLNSQEPAIRVQGRDASDQTGSQVTAGDIDGDGADELFVAATSSDGLDNAVPGSTGEVYVVYGVPKAVPTFEVHRGLSPVTMGAYLADVAAPVDDAPGTLADANSYYYRVEAAPAQDVRLAVNKQNRSTTVRLSWFDPDRCTAMAVSPGESRIGASAECLVADGTSMATVTVVPRDEFGDVLGTGLSVFLDAVAIAPGILVGEMRDNVVGSYSQEVRAVDTGTGRLVATVDGKRVEPGAFLRFVPSVPEADFSWSAPARAGLPVSFTDRTQGGFAPFDYTWDLDGDGTADSTSASPSFTYPAPGSYTVVQAVTDVQGCPSSRARSLEVVP